jgi:hypothetical protein
LDGVSIHPATTKIKASSLTQLPERKETDKGLHHDVNGDVKTVTELNGCDKRTVNRRHSNIFRNMHRIGNKALKQ